MLKTEETGDSLNLKMIGRERTRLESRLKDAEEELERLERRLSQRPEFGPGKSSGRAHTWEMALARRESTEARVTALQRALQRLGTGGYGRCQRCGGPINPERLEILPAATLCINCAQATAAPPDSQTVSVQATIRE
jgi:RNA polymerase-binding transcription factor DksA